MKIEDIARIAHEVNRVYCQSLGDSSQPPFDAAPDWQKRSAIMGVEYHLLNPNSTPSDSHTSWLAQKTREGWTYGPVKDPATKQHPCMVPYEQLPQEQQVKDFLFLGVVRACEAIGVDR